MPALLYHSTLDLRVIKKKKKTWGEVCQEGGETCACHAQGRPRLPKPQPPHPRLGPVQLEREIGNLLPNIQRQRCTCYALCHSPVTVSVRTKPDLISTVSYYQGLLPRNVIS